MEQPGWQKTMHTAEQIVALKALVTVSSHAAVHSQAEMLCWYTLFGRHSAAN